MCQFPLLFNSGFQRREEGGPGGHTGYQARTLCLSLPKLELRNSGLSEFAIKSPKLLGNITLQAALPLGPSSCWSELKRGYLTNVAPFRPLHRQLSPFLLLNNTFVRR